MIRGLYTAASGMVTGLHMQDIVAENLANLTTTGFKGERATSAAFPGVLARRVGDAGVPSPLVRRDPIGRIGTGSYVDVRQTYVTEGVARTTGMPLDFMIQGDGFLLVQTDEGVRYTRDGHLGRNADNLLVNAAGDPILDVDGEPVVLENDRVRLATNGDLFREVEVQVPQVDGTVATEVRDEYVTTLQVVNLPAESLVRAGDSQFVLAPGGLATPADLGGETVLAQGVLEESNVEVAQMTSQLLTLARQYSTSQQLFSSIDETLLAAVRDVGRVA